jgi:hypothetical protein
MRPKTLTLIVLCLAALSACTNHATTSAPIGPNDDPYFDCHTAAYARRHIDVCSGILK